MSDKSAIEWTDATWNPTTGCDRVSPGCANCYALDLAARLKRMGQAGYQNDGDPKTSGPGFALTLQPHRLEVPFRWSQSRRVFVDSMSDLFHEKVPDEYLDRVFAVMALTPQHSFQVLTKRPKRLQEYVNSIAPHGGRRDAFQRELALRRLANRIPNDVEVTWPIPNVWLGTSVENAHWKVRIDELRKAPAAVRFLSCEPLLGDLGEVNLAGIDWVIAGGESGIKHRPVKAEWIRTLRDQSAVAGVAFLFKQWGGRTSKSGGRTLDGQTHDQYPRPLQEPEKVAIAS
ncbi:MAG TPA: phage Gp37/Gp68 family protein [Candidatus Limnocylindrales bacterium]|nr:phage Gp37/Gp68 family protein [Candidatus Limnocylindrales bacterium]